MKVLLLSLVAAASAFDGTEYSEADTRRLTLHSFNSYCGGSSLAGWSSSYARQPELIDFIFMDEVKDRVQDTFGYVGFQPSTQDVVVSFRGSANIANWLNNLDYKRTSWDRAEGQVHKGFLRGYSSSLDKQVRKLVELALKRFEAKRVTFTGHSLGGALATLAAVDIGQDLKTRGVSVDLVTFGSPRVGDETFVKFGVQSVTDVSFRIVNRRDAVPAVPSRSWGFAHVPQEVWYRKKKDYVLCDDAVKEDKNCSRGGLQTSFSHHSYYVGVHSGRCSGSVSDLSDIVEDAPLAEWYVGHPASD
ncbi:MAG: hypothetical protein MHM6MM_003231 [Cercozoa sp. M6MM]